MEKNIIKIPVKKEELGDHAIIKLIYISKVRNFGSICSYKTKNV